MAFNLLAAGLKFDKKNNAKALSLYNPSNTPTAIDREDDFFTSASSSEPRSKKRKLSHDGDASDEPEADEEVVATLRKLYKIKCTGEDIPNPLASFPDLQQFDTAPDALKQNLMQSNYAQPTPIQMQAIPIMLQDRDLLAVAPTGSGKTLAFLLPLLLKHLANPATQSQTTAIIIEPTRELARQVYAHAVALSRETGWKVSLLGEQEDEAEDSATPNVVITTPLKLVYALKEKQISPEYVQYLVLDEADKLFEDDFLSQTDDILSALTSSTLHHAMFSATFSSGIETFAMKVMSNNMIRVIVGTKDAATSLIAQELTFCGTEEGKLSTMRSLINSGGIQPPVLVFTQSVDRAADLNRQLQSREGIKVDVIHSERPKNTRDRIIQQFADGTIWILICTDVMARGIDFKGVNLVINYDFPQSSSSYIHRIGRTGRNGRPGKAVTFFTKDDSQHLKSICNIMRNSGCDVPEWMLQLKNPSKKARKKLRNNPVERQDISKSNGYPLAPATKTKSKKRAAKTKPKKSSKAVSLAEASDSDNDG